MSLSRELMLDRVQHRDPAYDQRFLFGVLTTGIYCRPSCGARRPKPENVAFFENVAAARAAGLRPCKRCQPDAFHDGRDVDREVAEELYARVQEDPAAFHGVADLVRTSGVGSSKLGAICRRYYHHSPAEILAAARLDKARREILESTQPISNAAFDAGYESLSVFNDHFRRRLGLTPRAYRGLLGATEFVVELPRWYPLELLERYLGRDPQSLGERLQDNGEYTFATALRGSDHRPARVALKLAEKQAQVSFATPQPQALDATEIHRQVLARLGLVFDPQPFERQMFRRDGDGARLVKNRRGLVIPQAGDIPDGLLWVIVGQQVSLASAFSIRRRLLQSFGHDAGDGLMAPPPFADFANVGEQALAGAGLSRPKASYLAGLARAVASGDLDLENLAQASAPEVEKTLLAQRGLGPWSAHYVMMRSLAFQDCVPVGDVALAKSLQTFLGLDERPDNDATRRLMAPFAPYRSLATFHFWHRLGDAQ